MRSNVYGRREAPSGGVINDLVAENRPGRALDRGDGLYKLRTYGVLYDWQQTILSY